MVKISPSILSADYSILKEELQRLKDAGADWVHIDVMDGHFVPNLTLGAPIVKAIRRVSDLPFDAHLMVDDPLFFVKDFAAAGADSFTFHVESKSDIEETITAIEQAGMKPALAVKPATPIETVFPYLDRLFMVLVMTVEPGFGGQSFMEDQLSKITALKEELQKRNLSMEIQVDGGINKDTIVLAAKKGANNFVSGSALFSQSDMKAAVAEFKSLAENA